ncbi:FHA domain-containing protein [Pseudonocardia sp. CA-107938]|uniref:FHA domain-containing protein n=1 Tax=Pseudonocardia sp. CA-107938 TaxID=3240021 RepID=UPI003D9265C8
MDRRNAPAPPLQVLWAGRWHDARAGQPFVIGRAPEAQLQIDDPDVSRRHIAVIPVGSGWELHDTSRNGTFVAGRRITSMPVAGELSLTLGSGPQAPHVVIRAPGGQPPLRPAPTKPLAQGVLTGLHDVGGPVGRLRIGRAPDNDVVIDDLLVSRYHAELRRGPQGWQLVDIGRRNGTFVNGRPVSQAPIGPGDVIGIGHALLQLDGDRLVEYADVGEINFRAEGLTVRAGDKVLLRDVGFALEERSLLAVVGPSGAGKSTLLRALTGFRPADEGRVSYADRDLYAEYDELRARIGLVPQDDILHKELTVRRALGYAARLRFSSDVSRADRNRRIDQVLHELGLEQQRNQRISTLSGGQRKRTSVALELLTRPSLLFLDEPTSGLDPGLDKSVMQTLRRLADDSRTVVVVTHSVAHLDVCDRLLLLAPGGTVAYFGPPAEALTYFGQRDFADLFLLLERDRQTDWAERFRRSPQYARYLGRAATPARRPPAPPAPAPRRQSGLSQFAILCRRYLAVIAADRQFVLFMAGLPLVLTLLMHALPGDAGLSLREQLSGVKGQPNLLLLVLIVGGALMGTNSSIRELVKEREIYRRERAIGMSRAAYLASKVVVLGIITGAQAVALSVLGNLGRPGPDDPLLLQQPMAEIVLAMIAMTVASMTLGLLVSAAISNEDRGMPLLVLLAMLQFMLSSAIIQVQTVPGLGQLSWLIPARWGFAMGASTMAIPTGPEFVPYSDNDPLWDHDAETWLFDLAALGAVAVLFVVLTGLLLRRLEPRRR